ncbi:hypothetical protein H2203_005590 [Taxawa tesnikishii (nom. ined.)]|nr:hypothetical protein H2203_005590 [Dothideales sp. JES 119]
MNMASQTITGLKRWSCIEKQLPDVDQINAIHIYDFDNTLFSSPLPNKQIWNGPTLGQLQSLDHFHHGGWWHDANILASTGKGWWNEAIVELVQLSMEQKDALTVLLTGRKESAFADLVTRMVTAKKLEFDMVCLKPAVGPNNQKITTTMSFKQDLLRDLVFTYTEASEVRIYEDRPKHTKGFRDFFNSMNLALQRSEDPNMRPPFHAEVIQVPEQATSLDPVTEVAEVQRMINSHNTAILEGTASFRAIPLAVKRTVFYTGYLISPADTDRLLTLVELPKGTPDYEVRYLANNVLITPRPAPYSILNKVGGLGHKLTWRVTGLAVLEQRVWAARVAPVDAHAKYYSENPTPTVVLALRRNAKPIDANRITNWQPVPEHQAFEFETVVGEKVLLRVEEERRNEDEWEATFPSSRNQRKHPREDVEDFPPLGSTGSGQANGNGNNSHAQGTGSSVPTPRDWPRAPRDERPGDRRPGGYGGYRGGNQNRGGRGGQRGGGYRGRGGQGRGGGGRGRGRGGSSYRSLDDNVGSGYGGGGMQY